MLRFDRDVVAGMYSLKVVHVDEAVFDRMAAGEGLETAQIRYVGAPCDDAARREADGFVTAEFAGTGFMLIKRGALEKMIGAYPHLKYEAAHDRAQPNRSENQYAFFDGMIDPESGHYLSEDYTFCRRWRRTATSRSKGISSVGWTVFALSPTRPREQTPRGRSAPPPRRRCARRSPAG